MRSLAPLRLLLCVTLLSAGAAEAAAAVRQDLVAHGSNNRFWLARVSAGEPDAKSAGAPQTHVYVRSVGESRWVQVARVDSRVVAMAHRATQLALLLEDGKWLLASDEAVVSGRALPAGGAILDFASNGDALFALGRLRGQGAGPEASHRLVLYSLAPGGWAEVGEVGPSAAAERWDVSLAVVDSTPFVATRDGQTPARIRLARRAPDGGWASAGVVNAGGDAAAFKLLGGGPVPVLWVLAPDGGYSVHWVGPRDVRSESFAAPPGVKPGEVAAALAIERVRVLYTGDGKLFERTYDPFPAAPPLPGAAGSGAATAPATVPASRPAAQDNRILLPAPPLSPWVMNGVHWLLTIALLFTVVASLRRHRQMQEAMAGAHKLPLAPPGRRLVAGLIDAAPLLAAAATAWVRKQQLDDPTGLWDDEIVRGALGLGVVLYFFHTTATELLLGRTVGKMVCGLRVVGLDGERPGHGALLARNLLRVIDVLIAFFPLLLVLYSPLRQRAGDVAAGTLVVLSDKQGEAELVDEAEKKAEQPAEVDVTG